MGTVSKSAATMEFVLTGFTQELGFRVFGFARVNADKTRTAYTVRADLALSRRYSIPMQELPLLCRNLLARGEELDASSAMTFGEEEMCLYASNCATARQAAKDKRKPPHRPASANLGAAWRGHTRPEAAQAPAASAEILTAATAAGTDGSN